MAVVDRVLPLQYNRWFLILAMVIDNGPELARGTVKGLLDYVASN